MISDATKAERNVLSVWIMKEVIVSIILYLIERKRKVFGIADYFVMKMIEYIKMK